MVTKQTTSQRFGHWDGCHYNCHNLDCQPHCHGNNKCWPKMLPSGLCHSWTRRDVRRSSQSRCYLWLRWSNCWGCALVFVVVVVDMVDIDTVDNCCLSMVKRCFRWAGRRWRNVIVKVGCLRSWTSKWSNASCPWSLIKNIMIFIITIMIDCWLVVEVDDVLANTLYHYQLW